MAQTPPTTLPVGVGARLGAGLVALGLLAVLGVGAWLVPAGLGHGTHTSLGLPACGWVLAFGKPCPTCGMTTAFAHAARLELWASFRAQPMGCVLAVLSATIFWPAAYVAVTGSRVGAVFATMFTPRVLWIMAGFGVVGWVYKIWTWRVA